MNTNVVGTFRDIEGDKKAGYHTIPVKYGMKTSIKITSILTIIWLLLTFILVIQYKINSVYFYAIMIIDIIILINILITSKQLYQSYSRETSLDIHKLFILERITLASAFIFIFIPYVYALIIYTLCLLITAIFQYILRNQYEFNKWTL